MKNLSNYLFIASLIFTLLGLRSIWQEYRYGKLSEVAQATIIDASIIDVRNPHSNYYLKATHHIEQKLAYVREGQMDTMTLRSNFLMYPEGKNKDNPVPIPTKEELLSREKYVRFIPEKEKKNTAFPDRIDIQEKAEFIPQYSYTNLFYALFTAISAFIIKKLNLFQGQKSTK